MNLMYSRLLKMIVLTIIFILTPDIATAQTQKATAQTQKDKKQKITQIEATNADENQLKAREYYSKGKELYEAKKYIEAIKEFQAAYDAKPQPAVLQSIAECKLQTNNIGEAIAILEQLLKEEDVFNRSEIEDRLAEAKAEVGEIELLSEPPGAIIWKDQKETNLTTPATIYVAPGDHSFAFKLEAMQDQTEKISVNIGSKTTVTIHFEAVQKIEPPVVDPIKNDKNTDDINIEKSNDDPPTAFWVAATIVGVGLVSGTVFGTMALGEEADYKKKHDLALKTNGERSAVIADISFGVALGAAIVGSIVLIANKNGKKQSDLEIKTEAAKITIVPIATGKSIGVSTAITF